MSNFEGLEAMDLEKSDFSEDRKGSLSASCSICLDLVLDGGDRSIAKLHCGHEFHLDCIGSAFNAKGAMQCPNCRKVEKGRWLYANGHRSSSDFEIDPWMTDDFYDVSYSELPFGFQWCPFRGITQLASLFEEGESQLNSYHESFGSSTYGDHSSASSSTHMCPYLALHGHAHAMHSTASSSTDSVPENNLFPQHPTNLGGGQPPADMFNSHGFAGIEPQNHNWQQLHSRPFSSLANVADQSASQFGPRLSRSDAGSHQRLGSLVHSHPLFHGSGSRSRSNLVTSMDPPVMGEPRGQAHTQTHRLSSNPIYQPSIPHSNLRSAPFMPSIRRSSRPRGTGFTLVSSLATTSSSSSAETGNFYGFTSVSSSANRAHQESDRFYGWGSGRDGVVPLPWIPLEGESQWWGPFNPNPGPQLGVGFAQRSNNGERNGQRMPPTPRMPPPSYM